MDSKPENCKLCNVTKGQYTCPRCNILYCSLSCYKGEAHSQCSEQFYQDCVNDELSSMGGDSESKRKMEEILRSLRNQYEHDGKNDNEPSDDPDSDDAEDDSLAERLHGINLDDSERVWEKLTENERKQFNEMIVSGKIRETLPEWIPWWVTGNQVPSLARDIPPFVSIMTKSPSPLVPFLVMNTVMAYQITLRVIRGEDKSLCLEAATGIWFLSSALRGELTTECNSFRQAVNLIHHEIEKCPWLAESNFEKEDLADDLRSLTTIDSCYLLQALSHIKVIFDDAIENVGSQKNNILFTGIPPKSSLLKRASKKLWFYLSWAKEYNDDEWDNLVENVKLIQEID